MQNQRVSCQEKNGNNKGNNCHDLLKRNLKVRVHSSVRNILYIFWRGIRPRNRNSQNKTLPLLLSI